MPFDWLARTLLVSLFLPPVNVLVIAGLALVIWRRWPRLGKTLAVVAALALWVQAMPWFGRQLAHPLERGTPVDLNALDAARQTPGAAAKLPQAVVILGGGSTRHAPEYGRPNGADANDSTLARVRYGAFLARRAQLPVLVSGGSPTGEAVEARVMAQISTDEFGVPVRWIEAQSLNTAQNAAFSAHMLTNSGVTRIYLVTSTWHMRRARDQFERAGLTVVPAPCCNANAFEADIMPGWWPTVGGLRTTHQALREWMGLAVGH
ncbi:YdcF family protein [Pandoraea apista]|uniref:YdcF family protein n=1 Tax=Pandoraea apista TaxID=93218 RepID=A0ABX9ZK43_9BURK|nr:YdcF family protein [Pandoraea apista]PTD99242.1 YdcF family protein [Pandoraea apista]RRJ29272.1 YdcF family protein [Pandoraea apista]RRJ73944.1 YdcF family protein [Pandoraea apista]RSD06809.1 YdcF family protein [Pandoraea apista]RSK76807.1 YdcF family protein [Pandoraea apista]